HALVRPAASNHFADQLALLVMSDQRRADQVWAPSTSRIGPVTEPAGLLELFAAALRRRNLWISLGTRRGRPKSKDKDARHQRDANLLYASGRNFLPVHSHLSPEHLICVPRYSQRDARSNFMSKGRERRSRALPLVAIQCSFSPFDAG